MTIYASFTRATCTISKNPFVSISVCACMCAFPHMLISPLETISLDDAQTSPSGMFFALWLVQQYKLQLICFLDNQDDVFQVFNFFPAFLTKQDPNLLVKDEQKCCWVYAQQRLLQFNEGKCIFSKENSYYHLFYIYTEDWKELWGKVVGVRTLLRQILTLVSHIYTCSQPQNSKIISLAEAMCE